MPGADGVVLDLYGSVDDWSGAVESARMSISSLPMTTNLICPIQSGVGCREATECHIDDSFLFEVIDGFLFWRLANDVAGAAEQEQIF